MISHSELRIGHSALSRRAFLGNASLGMGSIALTSLLAGSAKASAWEESPQTDRGLVHPLHVAPRAKRVIFLCMAGGPSHLETFDYKPTLAELDGQPMPESFTRGQPIAQLQ